MSHDDAESEGEELELPPGMLPLIRVTEQAEPSLRWTPTTFVIDLFMALCGVMEAIGGFFHDQARSLAARASLKEGLNDHEIKLRLRADERRRMQLQTLEDITYLPGTSE